MKKLLGIAQIMLIASALTACSGVLTSSQPAKQFYTLAPLDGSSLTTTAEASPELTIAVRAVPGLDTDRILALGDDARLHRLSNARWPDHLPEVLSSVMKRSLAASGQFKAVNEGARPQDGGWMLKLEVQQFYGIRNSTGTTTAVRAEVAGTINCKDGSFPLQASHSRPLTDDTLANVVAAHQASLDRITEQLAAQISAACK